MLRKGKKLSMPAKIKVHPSTARLKRVAGKTFAFGCISFFHDKGLPAERRISAERGLEAWGKLGL